jgi:hypothetical protein
MTAPADTYGPSEHAGSATGPDCSWCGLRQGPHLLYGSPTCPDCLKVDRKERVRRYTQRLRRAAERNDQ